MSAGSVIFAVFLSGSFLVIYVLAVRGFRSIGQATQDTEQTGSKKTRRTVTAQRRASRPRKRDQVTLLPADATVTFADERQAAGIDEAYYLYRVGDSLDYGQEAIDILLQVMENDRDKLVVILAGYKDRMDEFFTSNPGMNSRIAHHLDFAAYELDELTAIGRLMMISCALAFVSRS